MIAGSGVANTGMVGAMAGMAGTREVLTLLLAEPQSSLGLKPLFLLMLL